ncbi:MAG: SH3 domain-containing protein [bacterium]|nr:SH3 domain-containing protein [bacterium]
MIGPITSDIRLFERYRPRAAGIMLVLAVAIFGSGCTFMENLRKGPAPAGEAQEIVGRRARELSVIGEKAGRTAPEELGAARVVLDEMSYFGGQGNSGEVSRLDEKMTGILDSIKAKTPGSGGNGAVDQLAKLRRENSRLQLQVKELEDKIKAQELSAGIERGTLTRRLEIVQAARDEAVAEVVRIRARIQGMASRSEASAMFAEARVLIDRMVEEAYREQALEDVELAEHYLRSGKEALDQDNPAGAAYLFDRVSELYTTMMKSDPRQMTVKVRNAALRKSPSDSSQSLGYLSQGDYARGQEKKGGWIRVESPSGLEGWILREQVQ